MAIAATRPYFNSHPEFLVLWIVSVAVAAGGERLSRTRRRREGATSRDRGSHTVFYVCMIPAALVLAFSFKLAPGAVIRPRLTSAVIGEVIFAVGIFLRLWSIRTLGEYFTVTVQTSAEQSVVEAGPYRWVRHPSYTAILLYAVGAGFIVGNWVGLATMTVLTIVPLVYRIRVEEEALAKDLGEPYRAYAAHHKRLIPKVW